MTCFPPSSKLDIVPELDIVLVDVLAYESVLLGCLCFFLFLSFLFFFFLMLRMTCIQQLLTSLSYSPTPCRSNPSFLSCLSDAAFERDKVAMVQHYESQIMALQDEMEALRHDFETERAAFQQLQSGDLAQSIRQELQVGTRLK